jgi:hypothetical protein
MLDVTKFGYGGRSPRLSIIMERLRLLARHPTPLLDIVEISYILILDIQTREKVILCKCVCFNIPL